MDPSSDRLADTASRGGEGERILVAGGTGFIGSAVVEALAARGARVTVLTRDPERAARGSRPEGVGFRAGDVRRPETLPVALSGMDVIVDCVQFPGFPVEDPSRDRTFLAVDAAGARALTEAARRTGARKFVYLSGVGADITSARQWYRAKGIAEAAVSGSELAYAIVRPSWVYGPGDVSLNRFARIIRWVPGFFPQIGPGDQRLNPVFIGDVAELVAEAATTTVADGRTVEIGGPEVMTLDEILRVTMRVLDREKPIVHFPIPLVKFGARLLELLPGQILSRDAVDFITQGAIAELATLHGLFPDLGLRRLEDALRETLPRS